MADDVTLKYGSTGFEKIQGELKHLEKSGSDIPNWFRPAHRTLEEVGEKGYGAFRKLSSGAQEASSHIMGFIGHLTRLSAIVTGVNALLGGLGVYAAARWTEGMLKATESNRNLEASLMGVLRNQSTVKSIFDFAKSYAAESPIATYHEVLETMRELAYQPAIKPILGDPAEMKRVMDVVQGLQAMQPERGIQGATYALRQALSGVWRSLQYEYGIRPETLAGKAGMTVEEMQFSPARTFGALEKFVLGATQPVASLTSTVKKLRETYHDFLEDIGKAGIYDKVLGYLQQLHGSFSKLSEGPAVSGAAKGISLFLESIADAIAKIVTVGIDWEKVADLPGALQAFRKMGRNTIEELGKGWEENKDWLKSTFEETLSFATTSSIAVLRKSMPVVNKAIREAAEEGMKEAPITTILMGAGAGAWGLRKFGVPPLIGAAAGAELVSLSSQLKEIDRLSREYDTYMRRIGDALINFFKRTAGIKVEEAYKHVPAPYEGPRPWRERKISELTGAEWPSEARYIGMYQAMGGAKEAAPLLSVAKKMQEFGVWSQMAGQLAGAPLETLFPSEQMDVVLRKQRALREKWEAGGISEEEYRPRMAELSEQYLKIPRMGAFRDMQMKYLTEITQISEAGPEAAGVRAQAYQQLFGISLGRGEKESAEAYMQKALKELRESFKDQGNLGQSIKDNATATKDNVGVTRDNVITTKELTQAIKQLAESGALNKKGELGAAYSGAIKASNQPESIDEIREDVERGYTNQ